MEPGYDVPASVGMAEADVQTPALIIDLDAFDHNLKVMRGIAAASGLRLRVHSKTHKSADIALAQMSRGGAVGICCQKVSEAEAMVRAGLHTGLHTGLCDIMVSNQVRGAARVARLARLAGEADMSVCVDDVEGVAELSRACHNVGTQLTVLVEIEVGQKRCGVQPHDAARLAGAILAAPNLHFGGLQAYNGAAQHQTLETERAEMMGNVTAAVREALAALTAAGIHCPW